MFMNNKDSLPIMPKNSCFQEQSIFFKEKRSQFFSGQQYKSVYGKQPENLSSMYFSLFLIIIKISWAGWQETFWEHLH